MKNNKPHESPEAERAIRQVSQAAVMHHGFDGLQVYPAKPLVDAALEHSTSNF